MCGLRRIHILKTSVFPDLPSHPVKRPCRHEVPRSMSMRRYPCLMLGYGRRSTKSYFQFCSYIKSLLDAIHRITSPVRIHSVFVTAFFIHYRFQYIRSGRVTARVSTIQSLALNQTRQLFFRIDSKDQENGPCRSRPLLKSLRPAGMPTFPGAVHEFA